MGKIFGICDNPVSTIESSLKVLDSVPNNPYPVQQITRQLSTKDTFVSAERKIKSNPFVKMRNGIGKLMSHFSKTK